MEPTGISLGEARVLAARSHNTMNVPPNSAPAARILLWDEVNERGSRLSAGRRQLISFTRALLADPKILILDEATSSIDTETEILLQRGLNELLKGRTSFIIAHRLSTIINSDCILYIDKGGILERGTHEELLAQRGAYYELYMSQFDFLA